MLGESCWGTFRDRVQAQYNYSLYTCHQRQIDGMQRGKFSPCVAESEQLCVAPYCRPRTAVLRMRGGATPVTVETAGSAFIAHSPPPSAVPLQSKREVGYPGPGLVLLGCEGCGVPELSRSLAGSRLVQLAATEAGEPSWRSRQVNFFDHEVSPPRQPRQAGGARGGLAAASSRGEGPGSRGQGWAGVGRGG